MHNKGNQAGGPTPEARSWNNQLSLPTSSHPRGQGSQRGGAEATNQLKQVTFNLAPQYKFHVELHLGKKKAPLLLKKKKKSFE